MMQTTMGTTKSKKPKAVKKVGRNPFEKRATAKNVKPELPIEQAAHKISMKDFSETLKKSPTGSPELNPWVEKVFIEIPKETVLVFVRAYGFMIGFLSS